MAKGHETGRQSLHSLVIVVLLWVLLSTASHADQSLAGGQLDETTLPDGLQANYQVMKKKCTVCHGLERVLTAVRTGTGPISGQPIDKATIKPLLVRMMRKPGAEIKSQDGKAILELLLYLLEPPKK